MSFIWLETNGNGFRAWGPVFWTGQFFRESVFSQIQGLTKTNNAVLNFYTGYKIKLWPQYVGADFPLGNSSFDAVKLTNNIDPDKYFYSGYGIGLDGRELFSMSDDSGIGNNVIIFDADMRFMFMVKIKVY